MKRYLSLLFALTVALTSFNNFTYARPATESLARQAVSGDAAESARALAELRAMGPDGLAAMLSEYDAQVKEFMRTGEKTPEWLKLAAAFDSVAMQKDSYAAGLFWYTDLAKAKAESLAANKPVLSLRLLGNLNEELSCANSRFFRSALYSNSKISQFLRDNYILHWQSVRPAPRVTIDFGDGRKMETTLTGNSIHYVLDDKGSVLDALPGLYAPNAFQRELEQGAAVYRLARESKDAKSRKKYLDGVIASRMQMIESGWSRDLQQARIDERQAEPSRIVAAGTDSLSAGRLAVSKSVTEFRILPFAVTHDRVKLLERDTDLDKWKKLAALHRPEAVLDENSRALIARKLNLKGVELDKLVKQFEDNVALDTVRNQYLFHSKICLWLSQGLGGDVDKFNEKVYSELFLTPSSDPWLGLYAPEIYNGIENAGISK